VLKATKCIMKLICLYYTFYFDCGGHMQLCFFNHSWICFWSESV